MKIAITCPGGANRPEVWSGTPFGLYSALKEQGHQVVSVNVAPPARLGSLYIRLLRSKSADLKALSGSTVRLTLAYSRLMSVISRLKLAYVRPELTIQIGTGYTVGKRNFVTFEDMTIKQALLFGWGQGWDALSKKLVDERINLQKSQYQQALAVATATDWAARSIVDEYGIESTKVQAVGLGSNKPLPHDSDKNKDWSVPKFLFIGNDWERKNGSQLLEAFEMVHKKFPDAQLHVVGEHQPIHQKNVVDYGKLSLGHEKDQMKLREIIKKSTCLVVPSRFEPAGIVYVEAGSYGVPSIGGDVGGAAFMIGEGGVVINPHNQEQLVEAMMLMCNQHFAVKLGKKAKKNSEMFTWSVVAQKIINLYQQG